mgnify:FL=1
MENSNGTFWESASVPSPIDIPPLKIVPARSLITFTITRENWRKERRLKRWGLSLLSHIWPFSTLISIEIVD